MKKKFFLSYLFAAMFLWAFAGTDDSGEWEYIRYSRSSPYYGKGYVILSKYVGQSTHVTIPQYLNISSGKSYVNEIYSSLLHNCSHIVSVSLGNISDIPSSFFSGCTSLETVSGNVFSIGANALSGCTHLKSFDGLSSVKIIDKGAFANCTSLISFSAPNLSELGEFAFKGCTALKRCDIGGSAEIPPGVFEGCTSLEEVNLSGSTYFVIGNFRDDSPFAGCSNLSKVTLGSGFTKIPEDTFRDLPSLTDVTVTTSLGRIGCNAFNGCTSLRSVIGSEGVNFVDSSAFQNCTSLESISFGAVDIGIRAFNGCPQLREVSVGGYSTIGNNAFEGCIALESLKGSSSVTDIGDNAFNGCSSLAGRLNLLNLQSLGVSSFYNCTSLISVVIGNLSSLGANAFSGCKELIECDIEGDAIIGDNVFADCESLEKIRIAGNMKFSDSYYRGYGGDRRPFRNCIKLREVELGMGVEKIPNITFSELPSLKTVKATTSLKSIDYDAFLYCSSLEVFEGFSSVTNIGDNAFNGCSSLVGPLGLSNAEIIGVRAFNGCGLLSGDLNLQKLEYLGDNAFSACSSLTSVVTHRLKNMGACAFERCTMLKDVTIEGGGDCVVYDKAFSGCSALETCILGKGVSEFSYTTWRTEASPFYNCTNLKNVVLENISTVPQFLLPNHDILERVEMPNVTRIDQDAFSGCPMLRNISSLANVTNIGRWAFRGCASVTGTVDLSSAEIISEGAFKDCVNITGKVELVKLKTVESGIFSGCERIRQVKFGKDLEVVRADAFSGSTNLIAFTFEGLPPEADNNAFRNVREGAFGIYPESTFQYDVDALEQRSVQTLSTTSLLVWCDVIDDKGTWKKLIMIPKRPILTNDVYDVNNGWLGLNWATNQPSPKEYRITYEIRRGFSDNYDTAEILTNGYDQLTYTDTQFDSTGGVSRIWYWVKPEHECVEFEHSDACRTKNRYGVSVGFSRYSKPNANGLTYFDAYEFDRVANKNGGFEMSFLRDEHANCINFISTIDKFSQKTTPGDIVLCFIATHGMMGDENEEPSLLFYDFWFSYSKLSLQCSKIIDKQARFVGIIMSCHAEAMVNGGKIPTDDEVLNNLQECGLRQCGAYSAYSAWVTSCRMTEYSHGKNGDLLTRFTRAFCVNGWDKGYADKNLYLLGEIITVGTHNDNRLNLLEIAEYSKEMYIGGNSGEPFKNSSSVGIHNPDLLSRIDVGSSWTADDLGGISAPINVRACKRKGDKGDECVIEWDSVMNADEYRVYRQFYGADPVLVRIVNRPLCQDKIISWFRSSKVDIRYFIQAVHERGISKKSNMTEGFSIDEELCLWSENYVRNYFSENGLMLATDFSENDWMKLIDSDLDGDGVSVCDEIVAGVSPIDNTSKFTANITMENGKPKVTPVPDLGEARKYTIYGKTDLGNPAANWTDMSSVPEEEKPEYRFFKVGVSLP